MAAYKKKFEAKRQASGAEEKLQNLRLIDERIKQARSDKKERKRRCAADDMDDELPLSNENDDDPDKVGFSNQRSLLLERWI